MTGRRFSEAERERFSSLLFETMEHLDPSDDRAWTALEERERDFYRNCVDALLGAVVHSAGVVGEHPCDNDINRTA